MARHALLAVLLAVAVVALLFVTVFRPAPADPPVTEATTSLWIHDFEDRLDSLARRLDELQQNLTLFSEQDGRPVVGVPAEGSQAGTSSESTNPQTVREELARLRSDLLDLSYRVQALEQDPINRGYAFLQSQSAELRREGIRSLRRLARFDPAARDALRRMLEDPDPGVRREAMDALGDIGDKQAIALLARLLDDPDPECRREAVQNLGKLGAKEAGVAIAALLSDGSVRVRREAADVLGRLGTKEAAPSLIAALQDRDEEVRGQAIASLGEIGAREALPALRELYEKNPGRQRVRLLRALKALGDDGPYRAEVKRLSEVALGSENARERGRALQMLAWFAPEEAKAVFQKAREDSNDWVRREAERILRWRDRRRR